MGNLYWFPQGVCVCVCPSFVGLVVSQTLAVCNSTALLWNQAFTHKKKNDWHTINCALNPQGWMYLALCSVVFCPNGSTSPKSENTFKLMLNSLNVTQRSTKYALCIFLHRSFVSLGSYFFLFLSESVDNGKNSRRVAESGGSLPYCDASLNTALGFRETYLNTWSVLFWGVLFTPGCVPFFSYFALFYFFLFTYICLAEKVAGIRILTKYSSTSERIWTLTSGCIYTLVCALFAPFMCTTNGRFAERNP